MNEFLIASLIENEERLNAIFSNIDVGLLLQGPNSEIFMSNDKAFEILGVTKEQMMGITSFDPLWNVIHEDGSPFPGSTHPVPVAIATKTPVKDVVMGVYRPLIGDRIWILVNAIPILNEDGTIKHVVCSFMDISTEKKAQSDFNQTHHELTVLYQMYKKTTENVSLMPLIESALQTIKDAFVVDGIALYMLDPINETLNMYASIDIHEEIINSIQSVKKGVGLTWKCILNTEPIFVNQSDFVEPFKNILNSNGLKSMGCIPLMIGNEAIGAINVSFQKEHHMATNNIQLLMAVSRQLAIAIQNIQLVDSLKKELNERLIIEKAIREANETIHQKNKQLSEIMAILEVESKIDPLTSLFNRRYMLEKINEEVARYERHAHKFSMVICDVDDFKDVNDTYGHAFGDDVLKTVSHLIRSHLREMDSLSRWGGDEFLILLPETELADAQKTIERIRQEISDKPIFCNERPIYISLTFGVALYNDKESIDEVIKRADDALYLGKKQGRNCVMMSTY